MDDKSSNAVAFLDALLSSHARLDGFSSFMYAEYHVLQPNLISTAKASGAHLNYCARASVSREEYRSGSSMILGAGVARVSAAAILRSNNYVEWLLSVKWSNENWTIGAEVFFNNEEDYDNPTEAITELATQQTDSLEDCKKLIQQATDFLVDKDEALRILGLYHNK